MGDQIRFKIALLGLGTVGSGVLQTLQNRSDDLLNRFGWEIDIRHILVRNLQKDRGFPTDHLPMTTDVNRVLDDPDLDLVVEVMGGIEPAKTLIQSSIRKGCHIVTANKELMAKYGKELLHLANEHGVKIYYEASVAGGIPILHTLQQYLQVNRIRSIRGIINGTCNYILTQMSNHGKEYEEALREAQKKGYAEADPSSDVDGFDAVYKLAILSANAFGLDVDVNQIPRQGIRNIQGVDIRLAKELGYVVKLIGEAVREGADIKLRVGPQLLGWDHPFARVDDVWNAVSVESDVVGELTLIGHGAGQYPTASAVVEDMIAILKKMDTKDSKPFTIASEPMTQTSLSTPWFYIRCNDTSLDTLETVQKVLATHTQFLEWRILETRNDHGRFYSLGGVLFDPDGDLEGLENLLNDVCLRFMESTDTLVLSVYNPALVSRVPSNVFSQVVNF
jgi:homoserine dehydrogenase